MGEQSKERKSPLRIEDEDELLKAFREQLLLERELERAKIDLIQSCSDFNLYDAFKILDKDTKGWIQAYEIRDALVSRHVLDLPTTTMEDVELFMKRYDRNEDRRVKFSEFCAAFTPMDP